MSDVINEPTLIDVVRAAMHATSSAIRVCLPARVESFDELTQTVSCTPLIRNPLSDPYTGDQDSEELPTIPNVKVQYPRSGKFILYFPLEKGDTVTLIFSDLSTAQWRTSGEISEALDTRRHSLGYPFAIPGNFADADAATTPINPLFKDAICLGVDGDPTGMIRVKSGSVECGGLLPMPLAMGVPTAAGSVATSAGLSAVLAAINGLAAAATAGVVPAGIAGPGFTAMAAALTALATTFSNALTPVTATLAQSAAAIPATITKGQ